MPSSALSARVLTTEPAVWQVYFVRSASGALYTGISTDPSRRLRQHQAGTGARSLRGKGPLQLVWVQAVGDKGAALRVEYYLKRQPKALKEQLIVQPEGFGVWQSKLLARLSANTGIQKKRP
ncbi:MAG: GIY-YIG nuclease family protein [Aeromonas sp.]